MHIVICGAGVIGGALAYELSARGADVTIIERWKVGGCASGKSGGFLAQDWCDGTPVAPLARRSFDLHEQWAEALGNPYGYRKVDTYGGAKSVRRSLSSRGRNDLAAWLADDVVHRRQLGTPSTTAQLDPEAFTTALVDAAVKNGAQLKFGAVAGLLQTEGVEDVRGVNLEDGTRIEGDAVVLTLGPWSLLAAQWLPLPPIYGLKGHSIIFKPKIALPPETIFAEFEDTDGEHLAPEIVPRADGSLYVCGLSGDDALPVDPARVLPEDGGCERLRRVSIS
ncbi:MAG: FAD-dependent oxidoreductase, partial [Pseudomonadota bacterium]